MNDLFILPHFTAFLYDVTEAELAIAAPSPRHCYHGRCRRRHHTYRRRQKYQWQPSCCRYDSDGGDDVAVSITGPGACTVNSEDEEHEEAVAVEEAAEFAGFSAADLRLAPGLVGGRDS